MCENIWGKKDIIEKYLCNGDFHFENNDIINLNFTLIQYVDGEIRLCANLNDEEYEKLSILLDKYILKCSIKGKIIDNNGEIQIHKAYLSSIPKHANFIICYHATIIYEEIPSYNNVKFGLINFLNNTTVFDDFNEFKCSLSNYEIQLKGIVKYKYYEKLLKENIVKSTITSEVIVFTENECIEDIEKLTYLLSYVNRTSIDFIYESYYHDDKLLKTVLFTPPIRNFSNNTKLIKTENLKEFIEDYFENFIKYYYDFSLNIVISIFTQGLSTVYSDIGYVLLEISLETFLSEYECYCKNKNIEIPINAQDKIKNILCNFFNEFEINVSKEDMDNLVDEISPEFTSVSDKFYHLRKNKTFEKNLKHQKGDDYFQTIRNKIAHTGKFPQTIHKDNKPVAIGEEFERLVYLIDRIILTLIGFEGSFSKLHGNEVDL